MQRLGWGKRCAAVPIPVPQQNGWQMLRINIQTESGNATLYCNGRIVFGLEVETLRSIVKSRTEHQLIVDLAGVETVDASGLGALVELQHWATRNGRSLSFRNASDFVLRLILLTRLYKVLDISLQPDLVYSGTLRCSASAGLTA